ncbi:hypothetical protein YWY31_31510 [Paenibacillus illinoisensis]
MKKGQKGSSSVLYVSPTNLRSVSVKKYNITELIKGININLNANFQ